MEWMMGQRKVQSVSVTIEEFAAAILPLIKVCLKEKVNNPTSFRRTGPWYVYRQLFYGFKEFSNWQPARKVSASAVTEYQKIDPEGDLRNCTWDEQHKFDPRRQKFHLEHIYTGGMLRNAFESLPEIEQTAECLVEIVREHYCVAWILKEENKLLPRSNRGKSLQEALNIYQQVGIKLL